MSDAALPARGLPVAVGRIDSELRSLWRAAGEGGPDAALTRASVLNLVIVTEAPGKSDAGEEQDSTGPAAAVEPEGTLVAAAAGEEEAPYAPAVIGEDLTGVIADVTAEHPCRVLNISARPDEAASGLSAYLSAFCRPARKNQQQVCCEEIRLEASGDAARHLHTTLAALLSQDLPVFLWWRGRPPFGSHRLQQMADMADRFIVDTAVAADPIAAVAELARWSANGNSRAATGDLAWRRLSPWREAVAALFDAADHRPLLDSIRHLELAWGAGPSCPGREQVLYLAGWMAARLGWRPRAAAVEGTTDRVKLILDTPTGPVSMLIRPANPGDPTLALQAEDSGAGMATAQVGCGETPQARLQQPGRMPWERPAPPLLTGTAAILSRELEFRRREPVFAEALACAGELAGLWQAAAPVAGSGPAS